MRSERSSKTFVDNKKSGIAAALIIVNGGSSGTRTLDHMIKSHVLYQLS